MLRASCPTELDEQRVIAALKFFPLSEQVIVILGFETGLRLTELCRLPTGAVWRNGACVSVLRISRRFLKAGKVGAVRARSVRSREIPLNDHAREYLTHFLEDRERQGPLWPQAPLFPGRDGRKHLSRVQAWRIIRKIFLQAGCDPARTWAGHSLRRRFVRRIFEATNLEIARRSVSHASALTTAGYLFLETDGEAATQAVLNLSRRHVRDETTGGEKFPAESAASDSGMSSVGLTPS